MPNLLESFVMTLIPLFIVIDATGDLLFLDKASEGIVRREQKRIANTAVLTAAIIGLVFLFFGQLLLNAMNISVGSFIIAGGIVLLVLSINYMVKGHSVESDDITKVAIVPLGTPLLAGPATITALLILVKQYPLWVVLISYLVNLAIAWGIFLGKDKILKVMGRGGVKAVSNVFNLLLAAIAVSIALHGLTLLGIIKA
jgi:multiple antibiotic resistance protein